MAINSNVIMSGKMLQIGDQFDRYQIQGHLAQGGMSDIYRAYDPVNRREVVLKIPSAGLVGDPAQYERFQREMEVMNSLEHPAILHGLGSGKYNRTPYLVLEYVDGQSLRDMLDPNAPMTPEQAVPLVQKIADGMAYAHEHGVVHRDLKPENILVTPEGQPIIMDFGLSLTKGAHRVTYSNLSATAGTPDYMAPEQVEGQRGDARTDIYALGTMLYEMLAGKTPFQGDNQMAVMASHLNGIPPRLDRVQPGISPQLAAVVARALERNPDDRYADMHAFMDALDHPETADLAVLDKQPPPRFVSFWQSQTVKAISAGLLILVAIVILAVVLQSLRR